MDYKEFLEAVRSLNAKSYSFGNETLYKMARSSEIDDKEKLAGAIWIIGRAYAASPQRRSYGKKWEVKTSNDGREGFFDAVAEKIDLNWLNDMPDKQEQLLLDGSKKDMDLLVKSIIGVLRFNLELSKAIEEFDGVTNGAAYCSNHISFCSKFLHFYFPHSVFIIDNYAFDGAKSLFNGKANNAEKWRYICDPQNEESYNPLTVQNNWRKFAFGEDVYSEFFRKEIKELVDDICQDKNVENIIDQYKNRTRETKYDDSKASTYIEHCARSYYLARKLKAAQIIPETQIKNENFAPMPRLIDTVFLNIKRKLSEKEEDKLKGITKNS